VLAWLLGEPGAAAVRKALAKATRIVASDLTLVECDRVLIRAQTLGDLREADAATLRGLLNSAAAHWNLLHVDRPVVERARQPFPGEPVRTLDAVHLASALVVGAALSDLVVLSLDARIRGAARQLGLRLAPS
jgi:predicted nucleic acid-binding protein